MRQTLRLAPLLLASLLLCGCGTVWTQREFFQDKMRDTEQIVPDAWSGVIVYRGTAVGLGAWGLLTGWKDHEPDGQDPAWYVFLGDVPFSLVADTLILPVTLVEQVVLMFSRSG